MQLAENGWIEEPEMSSRKAVELARRTLDVAEYDPGIVANAALVLAAFGEDIETMIGLIERALATQPSFARGWYLSGALRVWAGQHDLGIAQIETSLRLSPRDRIGTSLNLIGQAYFFKHEFEKALSNLLLAIQDHPGYPHPYRFLAACYAHVGRLDEARETVSRLRAITSLVIPDASFLRNPKDREFYLSALRLAAGE